MSRLGASKDILEKAVRLAESGKKDEAMATLKDLLINDQENGAAWHLLAQLTDNPKEREYALYQVNKLGSAAR